MVQELKISMATEEIAKLEGLRVDPAEVDEQIAALKKQAAEQEQELGDEAVVRPKVEAQLLKNIVFNLLADKGDMKVTFAESDIGEEFSPEILDEVMEAQLKRENGGAAPEGGGGGYRQGEAEGGAGGGGRESRGRRGG